MPVAAIYGTKHYAIQSDHLNTPRRLIQSDGQVAWQWAYSAFGDEKPTIARNRFANTDLNQSFGTSNVPAVTFNLRYPGQYFDQESGLHYNYHRSYHPGGGRYTQADPIGLDGGWNGFAYAENDPLSNIDPDGLSAFKIISLCTKGYKVVKEVGLKEAIKAIRRGDNVLAPSHTSAKQAARIASQGKKPVRDPAHKPNEGQKPHYHPNPRNGSHVFYNVAAGLTASNYLQCESTNPCIAGTLGSVIDFFNPLAIGQDAIDAYEAFE
jgi:RHS repeat-associated protein